MLPTTNPPERIITLPIRASPLVHAITALSYTIVYINVLQANDDRASSGRSLSIRNVAVPYLPPRVNPIGVTHYLLRALSWAAAGVVALCVVFATAAVEFCDAHTCLYMVVGLGSFKRVIV